MRIEVERVFFEKIEGQWRCLLQLESAGVFSTVQASAPTKEHAWTRVLRLTWPFEED